MDRKNAVKLVEKTFGGEFNEDRYLEFVIEMFGDSSFLKSPKEYSMWEEYAEYTDSLKYYGTYTDSSNKTIDVLSVRLKKDKYVTKSRTVQRNIILKWIGGTNKDGALVAFYSDELDDWRFSFVKMEYKITEDFKIEKGFTPAKRCSFLVGKNGANYTCKKNFLRLIVNENNPALEEIENAFNVENISDEFLRKYENLFSGNTHNLKIEESQIMDLKHIMLDYGRLPLDNHQKNILDKLLKTTSKNIKRFLIKYKNNCNYIPISDFKLRMLLSDEELILCIFKNMKYVGKNIIYLDKTESEIEKERIEKNQFNKLLLKYKDLYCPDGQIEIIYKILKSQTDELKNMLLNYEHMSLDNHQKQILDTILKTIGRKISYMNIWVHDKGGITNTYSYKKYKMKMSNKDFALFILKNAKWKNGTLYINEHKCEKQSSTLKKDNTVKRRVKTKMVITSSKKVGKLENIIINNKLMVKKVMSCKFNDNNNKLIVYVEHNKKPLKITIIGKNNKHICYINQKGLKNKEIKEIKNKYITHLTI